MIKVAPRSVRQVRNLRTLVSLFACYCGVLISVMATQKNTVILQVRRFSNSSGKGDGHDETTSIRASGFSVGRKRGL